MDKPTSFRKQENAISRNRAKRSSGAARRRKKGGGGPPGRRVSVVKPDGFSRMSIILLTAGAVVFCFLCVFAWDVSANDQGLLTYLTSLLMPAGTGGDGSDEGEEKEKIANKDYPPLPINNTPPPRPFGQDVATAAAAVVGASYGAGGLTALGPTNVGRRAEQGLVWIPGGWFWMGDEDPNHPMAAPIHKVYVDGFWMARYETTNEEWEQFVKETGYRTVAERKPNPKHFPDLAARDPEWFKRQPPFSAVFSPPRFPPRDMRNHQQWWKGVPYADWAHPLGPKSSIERLKDHPVVHISWDDAQQFLKWKNNKLKPEKGWVYRLPTEAEWEFAARGGRNRCKYVWGDELAPDGIWLANIWQGRFPVQNTLEDGYYLTAPVGTYPPNGFGLYDMAGNVWEWCHDWYLQDYYGISPEKNPTGPPIGHDPLEPGLPKRVQRGGSFLCHFSYCERYLTYARGKGEVHSAANHIGFRYVLAREIKSK